MGPDQSLPNESDRRTISISSDENGNWSFEQLPKGSYEISVDPYTSSFNQRMNVYGGNMGSNHAYGYDPKREVKFARTIKEFTLSEKDLTDLVIELSPGATISGKVKVEGRGFPQSVDISFVNENERKLGSSSAYIYDKELGDKDSGQMIKRNFELESVPSGKGYLRISVSDDRFYVKSARLRTEDLLGGLIDLKEGQAIRGVEIVLGTDVGTIKGKVITEKNVPAAKSACCWSRLTRQNEKTRITSVRSLRRKTASSRLRFHRANTRRSSKTVSEAKRSMSCTKRWMS